MCIVVLTEPRPLWSLSETGPLSSLEQVGVVLLVSACLLYLLLVHLAPNIRLSCDTIKLYFTHTRTHRQACSHKHAQTHSLVAEFLETFIYGHSQYDGFREAVSLPLDWTTKSKKHRSNAVWQYDMIGTPGSWVWCVGGPKHQFPYLSETMFFPSKQGCEVATSITCL